MLPEEKPLLRVMGLHSMLYCERLFYLEEVERIALADANVYAGRTLHEEIQVDNDEINRVETFEYTSENLQLTGKVDRLQKRDGNWIPYEHKRGKSKSEGKEKGAWDSDIAQVTGYALLIEEQSGRQITEGRIKYHRDNVLVKVAIDDERRDWARKLITKGLTLMRNTERPAVTENENLCLKCSLAPVCLPEENRIANDESYDAIRLFPPVREKKSIHVSGYDANVKKKGDSLLIQKWGDAAAKSVVPIQEVDSLSLHGNVQISTQVMSFLAYHDIPLHFFTRSGAYIAGLNHNFENTKRKIRQFQALEKSDFCLYLTRKLALAKCESQVRYILRATRGKRSPELEMNIQKMRELIKQISPCDNADSIRGYEGSIARYYHDSMSSLISKTISDVMRPDGRTKRPPKDRYNAALSFLYSLLYKTVHQAIIVVGLEPALGFFHTARSSAPALVLDMMELFRVSLCDMPLIGSVNRNTWDIDVDFSVTQEKVWLSDAGRAKAIKLFEERLDDTWKHPVTNYSMSYYRLVELEVRLLEKEWTDKTDLFAKARLR